MICKPNNNCVQNVLPTEAIYFKEESICEVLSIPCQKPDMERILDMMVWPEIESMKIVETVQGLSNEGQRLTGIKLVVEVRLKEKLTYVALEPTQSVHAAHFESLKSMFIVLPAEVDGRSTCDLVRTGRISVIPYVEAVYPRMLDSRTVHKCVLLFINAKLC
ncbi:hypothetical protein [Romboutsia sp.]|uniref:hypothetical protein n=1 Tax=Romboutsia sp. TaxID=1965302 RepID=UPI003F3ED8A7